VRHRGVLDRERVPDRCNSSGAAVDLCSAAPPGRNGLSARRMAVLSTLRVPLCVATCTVNECATRGSISPPSIPATACHQGSYFETYSRSTHCRIACMCLWAVPPTWAEAAIQNRRRRRCGNGPEHVSFHHPSPYDNRGERAWASLTVSATCAPSASR
jgi:hypothetical protein